MIRNKSALSTTYHKVDTCDIQILVNDGKEVISAFFDTALVLHALISAQHAMDRLIVQHGFQLCVLLSKPKAVLQVKLGLLRSRAIRYHLTSSSMSMVPEQKLLFVYYQRYISSVEECVRAMF